ncbi:MULTISPECIES: tRNA epoxyqueuosine(34) reductase QueG [Vibrio]|jgi:epoxyqueuosine reductase|uniref:Epoxyqueuosine reductase n=4 Tax=Vibrio harveyi group TaxID=717610 RepID=A0A0P7ELX5_VIBAL|nr:MULTISPECIES: tRNA epoxyqueuosine(34) reductase QueG [Vibrio]MDW1807804.1 tRNA epoxyqueuosine(34) reductase QueG [Vibrio sp. Vb2362]QCO87333.1 tRNA epoxyqueuosine(34) reductase QueG [Vibrio neocaledonicus]AGV17740.1 iron-sulfur cluster-binding protein [Vibrio alginolyticus NBRC 15630 = ATCC 17749]AVF66964.1 tRNA epoxyqueuosine(34) reductase QueG [Vibrio alginolyticus]AVF69357.1 tRNA epoxyqueuosine(34) reductase QueG [Vibrio alginolyticus]
MNYEQLAQQIKVWGKELGFQKVGICDVDLSEHEAALQKWLDAGYHGSMDWMARHGMMRARPHELLPGTVRVISVRMDYLPPEAQFASNLANKSHAYISRYALGRDYHKLVRKQLNKLGKLIEQEVGQYGYRPFVDSAPILERPLAQKAGLGWTGKHSLILDQDCGSWFFLGELLIDLPLPVDEPSVDQCGKCKACITSCPTQAIVEDKVVDARRCISYLTIEFDGVIPEEFRKPMGNRIYGCDDCQLVCPWNRYADITEQDDFHRRDSFKNPDLVDMFNWDEATFLKNMEGSAIRRIGHIQWLRNIAVALGNAEYSQRIIDALESRQGENKLLDEHIKWALTEQLNQLPTESNSSIETKKQRLIRIVEKGLPRDA